MRVALTGTVAAFRTVEFNKVKVGQVDLVQHGDHRHPSKVISIHVASQQYCRSILEAMQADKSPMLSLICWLEWTRQDIEITLLELVAVMTGAVADG
jgi:hypothetical protein